MDNKNLSKVAIIYAIGQILSKVVSFILLPVYTNQLGVKLVGKLSLVDAVYDFLGAFLILSVFSGYIRYYNEYKKNNKHIELKNTAITFALLMIILQFILLFFFGENIAKIFFTAQKDGYLFLILVVLRGVTTQFLTLLICDYTLEYKANKTVMVNTLNLVISLLLIIIFVVKFNMGILGIYTGYIIGNTFLIIILFGSYIKNYRIICRFEMLKNMVKFSGGFLPSSIANTILNLSDRYFLSAIKGDAMTGVYSTAYKFGMLIDPLFIGPFKQMFTPYKFEIYKDQNAREKFNKMYNSYILYGAFIMLLVCVYSKTAIKILTTEEYKNAFKIVPLIIFSYFLYGKSMFYSIGMQVKNKVYYDGFIMGVAGVINLLLNFIIIPKLGMVGAAISTILSYLVMNFLYVKVSLPLYKIKFNKKNEYKIYGILTISYLIYITQSIVVNKFFIDILFASIAAVIYVILAIKFKLIHKEELKKIRGKISKKIKIKAN